METPKLIYPFPWGAQSCPLPWLPCTPPIPILLIVVLIDRALIAGGLAEEPHGKLCVACVEFPVWCQRGVYLSECRTRPSRAASPALSAAQTAQGKRLAGGNEARADLHLLGWTIATSTPIPAATGSITPLLFLPLLIWKTGVIIPITYLRGCCEFS